MSNLRVNFRTSDDGPTEEGRRRDGSSILDNRSMLRSSTGASLLR